MTNNTNQAQEQNIYAITAEELATLMNTVGEMPTKLGMPAVDVLRTVTNQEGRIIAGPDFKAPEGDVEGSEG